MCKNVLHSKFRSLHIRNTASAPYPLLIFLCLDSVPVHFTKYLNSFSYLCCRNCLVHSADIHDDRAFPVLDGTCSSKILNTPCFLGSDHPLAHHVCDFQAVKLPECDLAFSFHTSRGIGPQERVSSISLIPPVVSDHESELSPRSWTPLAVSDIESES